MMTLSRFRGAARVAAPPLRAAAAWMSTSMEDEMTSILLRDLEATSVKIDDTSGGCGAMFAITCESPLFAGKRLVQQHRMVNDALKTHIADIHGLTINTKITPDA